jgi:hypothetical protein
VKDCKSDWNDNIMVYMIPLPTKKLCCKKELNFIEKEGKIEELVLFTSDKK